MILLGDAANTLQWALDNVGSVVWLLIVVGGMVGFAAKRQRKSLARTAALNRAAMQPAAAVASAPAAGVSASPSYAVPAPPPPRIVTGRSLASSLDAPAAAQSVSSRVLHEAFGDPAHARAAVILAEVLAPPVALR